MSPNATKNWIASLHNEKAIARRGPIQTLQAIKDFAAKNIPQLAADSFFDAIPRRYNVTRAHIVFTTDTHTRSVHVNKSSRTHSLNETQRACTCMDGTHVRVTTDGPAEATEYIIDAYINLIEGKF